MLSCCCSALSGLAWLTERGVSLALRCLRRRHADLGDQFKHRVGTDIRPFHDVLLGLFFITVGMLLDWHIVWERWPLVLLLLAAPLLFKLVVITGLTWARRAPQGTLLRVGSIWRRPASLASCCCSSRRTALDPP